MIEVHPISYRIPERHRCKEAFLNVIAAKSDCEWISAIKNGIMSASNPEIVVDHVSDLSSAKEPILFLSFLFSSRNSG